MRNRLGLIIPFALFAIFFALYTAVWNHGATIMKREIVAFEQAENAAGRSFSYDELRVQGYPLSLRGTVENVSWSDLNGYGFSADELQIVTLPYDPSRIIFAPQGAQTATILGETYDLQSEALLFSLEDGFAAAEGQDLELTNEERAITVSSFVANQQQLEQGISIAADVRDVDFGGELSIRMPLLRLSAGQTDDEFNIGALQIAIGRDRDAAPTNLSANGQLTGDEDGRLSGNLEISFRNEQPALMLLADLNVLGEGESKLIIAGLGLLTNGGTEEQTLPLVLEDGDVYLAGLPFGRVPLGSVPPLRTTQ